MRRKFKTIKFTKATKDLIARMDAILTEYGEMGYRLTVRQLYYQLVARDIIPNSQRSYKRIVSIAGKARMAGMLDWSAIEDRGRRQVYPPHWTDPSTATKSLAEQFRVNRWINQPKHVEVFLEKDALAGVLGPVCRELDVRLHPNRGYSSLSKMFDHGRRLYFRERLDDKEIYIIYVGDHDPSGMDMDRDIVERLDLFSSGATINFERVALTMAQIQEKDPPPQWAKAGDSRSPAYVAEFGYDVWELDALDPPDLAQVVKDAVLALRDEDLYTDLMEMETAMRESLEANADDWREDLDAGDLDYVPDWYVDLAYDDD